MYFQSCFFCFYRSSSALHRRSSTEILPDYWGTLCAGVCPRSVFSFLVAAGFEPMLLSLRRERPNRYPILTPKVVTDWSTRPNLQPPKISNVSICGQFSEVRMYKVNEYEC